MLADRVGGFSPPFSNGFRGPDVQGLKEATRRILGGCVAFGEAVEQ